MKRVWQRTAVVLAGLLTVAMYAMPQGTISARPGVVNYIEGQAFVDGQPISAAKLKNVALHANQVLSTDTGKAEVLLTPGVFLRIGDNSEIRMISPSLTDTQLELLKGEAMVEAAQIVKDSSLQIIDHGSVITIEKSGLYRITADNPPAVAVFDGKALVQIGERKQEVKKDKQLILAENAKPQKFDKKKEDELYAWSNVRSEYEAAASYASAKTAAAAGNVNGAMGLAYGFGGGYGPGWYYNAPWNAWAWLPGAGYAFSPFGYGFFSPGYIPYAPVIVGGGGYAPGYYGRGNGNWNGKHDHDGDWHNHAGNWHGHQGAPVPVNPNNPPAQGMAFRSPAALSAARTAAFRSGVGERATMSAPQGAHISGMSAGHVSAPSGHFGGGMGAAHAGGGMGGGGHAGGGGGHGR